MDMGPGETAVAARAATMMAYVVAVAGAGSATILLRAGEVTGAVLVLTTTLGVAALLASTGTLLRGLRDVERRLRRIEDDLGSAAR
jgi:hypothetical protein